MTTEELRKIIYKFEQAEDEREGKYFKEYRKLVILNGTVKLHDGDSTPILSGRIWGFLLQSIYDKKEELMVMAIEKEQKDFEMLEKRAKEAAIEFATGMSVTLNKEQNEN